MGASLLLIALFLPQAQIKEEDVRKAKETLQATPDDPAANLVVGKYAILKGDWEAAVPCLSKCGDATLKAMAEKEIANPISSIEQVGLGDGWIDSMKKHPAFRRQLQERATFWYAKAWPDLDAVWKDKLRTRLRQMYQVPGLPVPKSGTAPKDWTIGPGARIFPSQAASHGGKMSMQIVCSKEFKGVVLGQSVILKPDTEYELSGWILTDETESADNSLYAPGYSADGKLVVHPSTVVFPDRPWWQRLSVTFKTPANAARLTIGFNVNDTKGTIYLDDISLKAEGKELLKNGSFEEK